MAYNLIICEDEPNILAGLCTLVPWSELGYEVKAVFHCGEDVLSYLSNHSIDVIMTDIVMDGIDGITLSREIHESFPNVRIVILSGHAHFEYAQKAIQYGVYRYLLKPTRYTELIETFKSLSKELDANENNDAEELSASSDLLCRVSDYILAHIAQNIPMNKMAEVLHYNPSYFSRLFKKVSGNGFIEFTTKLKMEYAKELFESGEHSVSKVAAQIGYMDVSLFSKNFVRYIGVKPSHYIRKEKHK